MSACIKRKYFLRQGMRILNDIGQVRESTEQVTHSASSPMCRVSKCRAVHQNNSNNSTLLYINRQNSTKTTSHGTSFLCEETPDNESASISPGEKKRPRQRRGRSILERPGVFKLEQMSREDVVHYLASQIVYNKDGIIGLNKPAGVGIHPANNQDISDNINLQDLLPSLSELLGEKHLHFVKAPERDCSGVTLLASGPGIAMEIDQSLKKARHQNIFTRRYWAVTVGVPKPLKGLIDVSLAEETRWNKQMVVIKKDASKQSVRNGHIKKTLTQYRVLDHDKHCALVELQPLKAYRHQLQVHMTTKLCCILGDHLYSSRVQSVLGVPVLVSTEQSKPSVQVLSRELLHRMNLTSGRMPFVPLHLHCAAITLPNWQNRADLTITAPMPKYFWKTLKLLGLYQPQPLS
ncbi:mitochondrial mRNA pseudouridine synthase Rpusd3-like [Ptychodera flava]|uniref:mitochondrial mRNA pseudouridine synthase Rpusd3-like n=1 Tax=Ptychodera flava TaxID=63121 RepID=UPI00396A87FC